MTIKKPINIGFEIIIYSFFVASCLYVSWNNILSEAIISPFWDYGIWALFAILLFSITTRAIRTNENRLAPSALLFGFFVGILLWTLFVVSESRSEGISLNAGMVLSILVFGCFTSIIAWLITLILSKLLLRLRRK